MKTAPRRVLLLFFVSLVLFSAVAIYSEAATTPPCPTQLFGDANCDTQATILDFAIWRAEFLGTLSTTTADFNGDTHVSLPDFAIWRNSFINGIPAITQIPPTNTPIPTLSPPPSGTLYSAILTATEAGTNSTATGSGTLLLAPDGKSATVTLTSTLDSSGNITAEHIHGPGALAGQYDEQLFLLHPGTQTIDMTTITPGQLNDLNTGKWYFNIHTFAFQGGEIRGTIRLQPGE